MANVFLTPDQRELYTFRVSLYRPKPKPTGGGPWAADAAVYEDAPAFTNVPCFYDSTPELDVPTLAGRFKELNLFTLDRFEFVASQVIADQWVIKMTGSDPHAPAHPYINRFWIVRDNPQTEAAQGVWQTNYVMVYATLANIHGLSGIVEGVA